MLVRQLSVRVDKLGRGMDRVRFCFCIRFDDS